MQSDGTALAAGVAIGFLLAIALAATAWSAWHQVEITRYPRNHPEERTKLRWPWHRHRRRSLDRRG